MTDCSDCFQVDKNGHGEGATYSRFSFASGELVYTVRGEATPERTRHTIEVAPGEHVYDAYARFINHSFTPNLRLEGRDMFALQDIAIGVELTFNYLDTESEISAPFVCHDTGKPVDSDGSGPPFITAAQPPLDCCDASQLSESGPRSAQSIHSQPTRPKKAADHCRSPRAAAPRCHPETSSLDPWFPIKFPKT